MKTQIRPFPPELAAVLGTGHSQKRYISVSRPAPAGGCVTDNPGPKDKRPNNQPHIILARIEAALDRLDLGTFGLCIDCGDEICLIRLDHDPSVPHCRDCEDAAVL